MTSLLTVTLAPRATAASTPLASTAVPAVTMKVHDRTLRFGDSVLVSGRLAAAREGRDLVLEHRTARGAWRTVARAVTGARGRYRLRAVVPHSGLLRVSAPGAAVAAAGAPPAIAASRASGLRVSARVSVTRKRASVRAGRLTRWSGRVKPAVAGRLVVLQRRSAGRWITLARTRTGASGRWAIRLRPRSSFSSPVRVRASGTANLAPGARAAGRLAVLRPALASWYGGGGVMACGARLTAATLGVAHKSLPCGTLVTIRYAGRAVRVPVTDRGPFIGAREFDLTAAVKQRLGFTGVGTIWVAY